MKMYLVLFSVLLSAFISCQQAEEKESDLATIYGMMTGSFSSEKQAEADSTYYPISLHMYPIWEASGEKWLYVEQAMATQQDKPYRQRVYKLEEIELNRFQSIVYTLKNDSLFVGKWAEPDFFNQYDVSILSEREGCAVVLEKTGENTFAGSTLDKACGSNLRGASYATSSVTVTPASIKSWDRGFNEADEQVWGAEKGGYIFDRLTSDK
ncbi:MAG: chromophore lyase CpcT/CpeT [Bacteroidota bacterium]